MGNKVTIVSGDGHVSPLVPSIIGYFEPILRDHVDDLIREDSMYIHGRATPARPPRLTVPSFDDRGLVRGGGEFGACDPAIRLQQMDAEGIAGEVLLPGTQVSTMPFFHLVNGPWPAEIRAAGARAYHRWLADFMAESDGRLFGVADPGPCFDMDATVAELEFAARNGFVSVATPGNTADRELPPLYDRHFEPFWAACADLGLVLNCHAGWGGEQRPMSEWVSPHSSGDGETTGGHDFELLHKMMQERNSPIRLFLQQPRRPMWQLMASGVFDRHPRLKLAMTEIRADWVPATLDHMEAKFAELQPPCERTPREYFAEHCIVIPSSPHRSEAEMRTEIGIEQFGFGQDFPHWESTWPNTLDWLRAAFGDATEAELRAIVGGNVVRFFGLPAEHLDRVAERVGPAVGDILGDHPVADELLQHFHRRAGYLRSADPVFTDELDTILEPDLVGAKSLSLTS
jgi:predicted TIM-barrel fold metal-dependent hydrolase